MWHWGPDGSGDLQGFLRSESHFSSTCLDQWNSGPAPTCHIIGDVGGDLVFGALKLAGNVQTWTWAVPVADVVAVYRRMGSAFDFVTPEAVTHCHKLLHAGQGLRVVRRRRCRPALQLARRLHGAGAARVCVRRPRRHGDADCRRLGAACPGVARTSTHTPSLQPPVAARVVSCTLHLRRRTSAAAFMGARPAARAQRTPAAALQEAGPLVWASGATFREQMGLSISSGSTIVAAVSTRSLVCCGAIKATSCIRFRWVVAP